MMPPHQLIQTYPASLGLLCPLVIHIQALSPCSSRLPTLPLTEGPHRVIQHLSGSQGLQDQVFLWPTGQRAFTASPGSEHCLAWPHSLLSNLCCSHLHQVTTKDFCLQRGEMRPNDLSAFTKHDCTSIICHWVGNLQESL